MRQWFPSEYYGNEREGGKNRHFYHVHNAVSYSSPTIFGKLITFLPEAIVLPTPTWGYIVKQLSLLLHLWGENLSYYCCYFNYHET